jgi:hypothetical protein
MIQYSVVFVINREFPGVLDARWSLSSVGRSADPLAGMTTT